MVYGADVVGHESRLGQVGSPLQSHGEGVQAGPVGLGLRVVLDAMLAELLGDGGDDAAVETAGEQYTIRNIGHELALHGSFKGIVDGLNTEAVLSFTASYCIQSRR